MNKKGFTLVEIIVAIAIMGILSVFLITSYVSKLQDSKIDADDKTLEQIDNQISVILQNDDVFEEVQDYLVDTNGGDEKDSFVLHFSTTSSSVSSNITIVADTDYSCSEKCPLFYSMLTDAVDFDELEITSLERQNGTYSITCKFNGTQLNENRPYAVTNDSVQILHTFS